MDPPVADESSSSSMGGRRRRFELLREGDAQVCRLNHARTLVSKLLSAKFLRRWEHHRLRLGDDALASRSPRGFLETPVPYEAIEDVYPIARWDDSRKYCLRIALPDGSLLLQAKNAYVRDQWFYSLEWKKNLFKYKNSLANATSETVLFNDLTSFIDFVAATPLHDECFTSGPLDIISNLLLNERWFDQSEKILKISSPILGVTNLSDPLASALSHICCNNRPLTEDTKEILLNIAKHILKHNADFGKTPHLRRFLQDYISALYRSDEGVDSLRAWVDAVHGPGFNCPHPRILPNLAAVCLATLNSIPPIESLSSNDDKLGDNRVDLTQNNIYIGEDSLPDFDDVEDSELSDSYSRVTSKPYSESEESKVVCFSSIITFVSTYSDWIEGLGALLQPIPIPSHILKSQSALTALAKAVFRIGTDQRCNVHRYILPLRPERPGLLHIFCSTRKNPDPNQLQQWGDILGTLLNCCCKRKCFLIHLIKMLPMCLLLALRAHKAGLELLCLMLEWELLKDEQSRLEAIEALRSTSAGEKALQASSQRQVHLKKLQQKGGPRKLTLPSHATDTDVARLLSTGSFGNLECLSLAFTHVTSAVAEQLIKLPSLRYLNLWATQFGDSGVLLIVEHLHRLQVLNLCETLVSDVGIEALAALTSLRKLNLNSTKLTAATWSRLRPQLPALQECDIRYTDAW